MGETHKTETVEPNHTDGDLHLHLLLLDLGSIYWSAWHASANDEISTARNATLGKVMQLRSTYPGLCAVCCDSQKSWRKDEYPEY